ncbi:MAG: BatA domain-containing protein, partial [Planctomycetota bacterium]
MTWLAPSMAWFGLLAPLVLLFWFLKIKRREIPISSTLLWSRVIEDKRVNSPLQRLRRSLVLLLQLLV